MKTISYLLLTFLLNSIWQIALVAAFAAAGAWVLRNTAGPYRHLLWMAALTLSLLLPFWSAMRLGEINRIEPTSESQPVIVGLTSVDTPPPETSTTTIATLPAAPIHVNLKLAFAFVAIFGLWLGFRSLNLIAAWLRTRALLRSATPLAPGEIQVLIARCREAMRVDRVAIQQSPHVQVPVAQGFFRARIILPAALVAEGDQAAL